MADTQRSEGLRLLEEAQWAAARDAFQAELDEDETPDAHDGIGLALFFLGRVEEGIAARERAFEGYVRADRCDEAARVGVWVSHQYLLSGRASAARGWLARAERAVADASARARAGSRSSGRGTPRASTSAPSTRAAPWPSRASPATPTSRPTRSACSG